MELQQINACDLLISATTLRIAFTILFLQTFSICSKVILPLRDTIICSFLKLFLVVLFNINKSNTNNISTATTIAISQLLYPYSHPYPKKHQEMADMI
jgi:hypothetical protein